MKVRKIKAIIVKELKELFRDRVALVTVFLVPILIMIVFGYGLKLDVKHVPFAVLDYDHSNLSRKIVSEFAENREYFKLTGYLNSEVEIDRVLTDGEVRFVLIFPFSFEKRFKEGKIAKFQALIDGTFPYRAEVIKSYIRATVQNETLKRLKEKGNNLLCDIRTRYWFNESLNQDRIVAVGTLAIALLISPAVFSALLIVKEKESGSIYNIYSSSITKLEFLLGKIVSGIFVSFLIFLVTLSMVLFLFGVRPKGDILTLSIGTVAYLSVAVAFGILISSFFSSQAAAFIGTAILTIVPSMLYSGYLTPVSSMDRGALFMAHSIPTFYYLRFLKGIFFKNSPIDYLLRDVGILIFFFFALFSLTLFFFKKRELS